MDKKIIVWSEYRNEVISLMEKHGAPKELTDTLRDPAAIMQKKKEELQRLIKENGEEGFEEKCKNDNDLLKKEIKDTLHKNGMELVSDDPECLEWLINLSNVGNKECVSALLRPL